MTELLSILVWYHNGVRSLYTSEINAGKFLMLEFQLPSLDNFNPFQYFQLSPSFTLPAWITPISRFTGESGTFRKKGKKVQQVVYSGIRIRDGHKLEKPVVRGSWLPINHEPSGTSQEMNTFQFMSRPCWLVAHRSERKSKNIFPSIDTPLACHFPPYHQALFQWQNNHLQ